ncbi:nuclear transport factor 2 family protein [Chloroflexota bacterium]
MANKLTLEERIELLEAAQESVKRLEAIHDIQNVMGRYMALHVPGPLWNEKLKLFALKTPGVAVEIDNWGVFEGADQVKACYEIGHFDLTKEHPGLFWEHDLTTPIIEVAGDGKTAKAVWFCPGVATRPEWDNPEKLKAFWRWLKIAAAFAKEDGKWKLWKYHVYGTFFADFYKSWVDYPVASRGLVKELNPKPPTYYNPYRPDAIMEPIPAAPEPYDTWDLPIEGMPI